MTRKLIDTPHRPWVGVVVLLVLVGLVVLAFRSEGNNREPVPASVTDQFSAERALTHLERFAAEPRPLGSPASDRAMDYIAGQMRSAGYAVDIQQAVGGGSGPGLASFGRVSNVIATLPGRDATGTVLLSSHYDSVPMGPGASDDGAAVAAMLEVGRQISRDGGLRNNLVLLFTDGEEDGLLGAEAFARSHPSPQPGEVVLNWEARGVGGASLMFETSRDNAELVSLFAEAVPDPRGDSSMVEIYRKMPNFTDFTVLSEAGFTGLNFANAEEPSHYHTARDSLANLNPRTLQHHGENMLSLTRALGATELPDLQSDGDATYFRLGTSMITYSNALVWPLAVLAVLLVIVAMGLAGRRGLVSARQLVSAAGSAVLPLAGAAAIGQALWWLLLRVRPDYHLMEGLLHRPLGYEVALAALVVTVLLLWYLPLRFRLGPAALALGALVWPAALGVVCAAFAPGASYLFTWSTMSAAIGATVALLPVRRSWWPVVPLLLWLPVPALLFPLLAHTVFSAVGLVYAGAASVCMALFGLLVLPAVELLLPDRTICHPTLAPAVVAVVAVLALAAGLTADTAAVERPRRSHLAYVLDADSGRAHWVSAEPEPTAWTRPYVTARGDDGLPPGYARRVRWTGPAEPIDVAGPRLELLHRTGETVTMHVVSPRAAPAVTVRVDHPIDLASARVSGDVPVAVPVTGTRSGTWPGEITFRDLPPEGIDLTVRTPGAERVRLTVIDETHTLPEVPGFRARPADTVAGIRMDGDVVAVARTYEM